MSPHRLRPHAARVFVHLARLGGLDPAIAEQAASAARFYPALLPAVGWHAPFLAAARTQAVDGITLGDVVYLRGEQHLVDWPLLVHELVHVVQFRAAGTPRFFARYGLGWLRGRAAGADAYTAYRDLPEEQEAVRIEQLARRTGRPEGAAVEKA
jgi:hypothetical protein